MGGMAVVSGKGEYVVRQTCGVVRQVDVRYVFGEVDVSCDCPRLQLVFCEKRVLKFERLFFFMGRVLCPPASRDVLLALKPKTSASPGALCSCLSCRRCGTEYSDKDRSSENCQKMSV